ncbi:hypothetical protein A8W25_08770 [Streptomyces sp. ERV7]|nr:hypothetical protein A8W25_08770 [Streptomyces sp. ERV7]
MSTPDALAASLRPVRDSRHTGEDGHRDTRTRIAVRDLPLALGDQPGGRVAARPRSARGFHLSG